VVAYRMESTYGLDLQEACGVLYLPSVAWIASTLELRLLMGDG